MGMDRLREIEKEISGERKITFVVKIPLLKIKKLFKARYLKWLTGQEGGDRWK